VPEYIRTLDSTDLDASIFWRQDQSLCETGSVKPMTHLNAFHPRSVRISANRDVIIVTMETFQRYRARTESIPIEGRPSISSRSVAATTRGVYSRFQKIPLYRYNFSNGYDINNLRMSSFYVRSCGQTMHILRVRVRGVFW
jgi:hypothetical protein